MDGWSEEEVLTGYGQRFPQLRDRVALFNPARRVRAHLAYTVFVHNAHRFLPTFVKNNLPFAFTLYPGRGLQLNVEASDRRLRDVFRCPLFRKVIVTQRITREYVLANSFCCPEQVEFIYGGVSPENELCQVDVPRLKYPIDKGTFDICFVANKYTPRGADKGYDVFIEVACALVSRSADFRFHVVGPFGPDDVDLGAAAALITFYGPRPTCFFPEFYSRMDAILSPNVPFVLAPGAFDGFPTGCCIEAGLCGVPVLCTDMS